MRVGEIFTAGILALLSIYLMWKSTELPIGYISGTGPGGGAWPYCSPQSCSEAAVGRPSTGGAVGHPHRNPMNLSSIAMAGERCSLSAVGSSVL